MILLHMFVCSTSGIVILDKLKKWSSLWHRKERSHNPTLYWTPEIYFSFHCSSLDAHNNAGQQWVILTPTLDLAPCCLNWRMIFLPVD
jgi:hypothetical protein